MNGYTGKTVFRREKAVFLCIAEAGNGVQGHVLHGPPPGDTGRSHLDEDEEFIFYGKIDDPGENMEV